MTKTVEKFYRHDARSMCSAAFSDFTKLMNTRGSPNETFVYLASRSHTVVTQLNTKMSAVAILETHTAWLLVHSANIDASQNVGEMSTGASFSASFDLNCSSRKNEFLKRVKYDPVAFITGQYDRDNSTTHGAVSELYGATSSS